MAITAKEVHHVMALSRLRLPEQEVARITHDLESILVHVEELKKADVTGITAMVHAVPAQLPMREDVAVVGIGAKGLDGSAGKEGRFVRVPKIVE